MTTITTIGLDLAKKVFQVHGVDAEGKVIVARKLRRKEVLRGKTDPGDAAAICEAVTRPSMTFVPVKGIEQQGLSMVHSARTLLVGQRTQLINAARGHLSELGIVAKRGLLGFAELAAIVRDESDQRLPATARSALMVLVRQIETLNTDAMHTPSASRPTTRPWRTHAAVSEKDLHVGCSWHVTGLTATR